MVILLIDTISNKNLRARNGLFLFKLLISGVSKHYSYCHCSSSSLFSRTWQQWGPIIEDITQFSHKLWGNQVASDLDVYPYWLAFIVLEDALLATKREVTIILILLWPLWIITMTGLERNYYWFSTGMNVKGVANQDFLSFKVRSSDRINVLQL